MGRGEQNHAPNPCETGKSKPVFAPEALSSSNPMPFAPESAHPESRSLRLALTPGIWVSVSRGHSI